MGRTLIVVLVCMLALAAAKKTFWYDLDASYTFDMFCKEFNKRYNHFELEFRKAIFEKNLETILTHNSDPFSTYKLGVNHLADRTNEEFRMLLGYKRQAPSAQPSKYQLPYVAPTKRSTPPATVDWRTKGVVTDVKDQGRCGSCWSFGTAEVIESYYAIATGQLSVLSEQQILDCVPNPNNCGGVGGCGGGTPELAFQKLIEIGGLASEWRYPYVSYFGQNFQCHYLANTTVPVAIVKNYVKLPENEYEPVIDALANGPLVINVDASAWILYESGVFTGCNQTDSDIDHVVLLVGYGTDPKYGDYWLIRNSWTPAWGELGYIRLAKSSNVQCTPDTRPQDGTGCDGGPSVVTVCGACGVLYDASYPIIAV